MTQKARLKNEVFKFNKKVANSGDIVTLMGDAQNIDDNFTCILENGDIVFIKAKDLIIEKDYPDWEQRKWDLFVKCLDDCKNMPDPKIARLAAYEEATRIINFYKREVSK